MAQEDLQSILESYNSSEDHEWVIGIRSSISDLMTDIYEKASKELWSVFHFEKNSLTINTQASDIDQLIKTLINVGYCSRATNKLTANLWQELLVKACSLNYSIGISGWSKPLVPTQQHVDLKFDPMDGDDIPVRDRDPQQPMSVVRSNQLDSGNIITIKAFKLEHPLTQVEKVFKNITEIITIFSELFSENVSYILLNTFAYMFYFVCYQYFDFVIDRGDGKLCCHSCTPNF